MKYNINQETFSIFPNYITGVMYPIGPIKNEDIALELINPMPEPRIISEESSSFTRDDRDNVNHLILTYFDVITQDNIFIQIKNYEDKFKITSDEFYEKWKKGLISREPETNEWASLYRNIKNL